MTRPARRAKKPEKPRAAAKSPVRIREASRRVAGADQVRADLDTLLKALEGLGVEALRDVSDRVQTLIAEKTGDEKRGFIEGVIGGAKTIGESITGLFGKAEPATKRPGRKKAGAAKAFERLPVFRFKLRSRNGVGLLARRGGIPA
jgi:hypothetical protein